MRKTGKIYLAGAACAMSLGGCSTVSFAPPPVPFNGTSSYPLNPTEDGCKPTVESSRSVIDRDQVRSALYLIDNYAAAYRCALYGASNGRQYFQIPSQLAALIGVAGAAFGGSKDLAIIAGGSAATFNSANNYWAPQEKAGIFDSAYDAIECIRMAAVGLDSFKTRDGPAAQKAAEDRVSIPVAWRYYDSIRSALAQVDRITGTRLRKTGIYDSDGLVAEIEKITDNIEERKNSGTAELLETNGDGTGSGSDTGAAGADDQSPDAGSGNNAPPESSEIDDGSGINVPATGPTVPIAPATASGSTLKKGTYFVKIPLLQSRLQLCIVKAKM